MKNKEVIVFVDEELGNLCIAARDTYHEGGDCFVTVQDAIVDVQEEDPDDLEKRIGATVLGMLQVLRGSPVSKRDYQQRPESDA